MCVNPDIRSRAIGHAQRFKWGFDNYIGGSDDWRCGANLRVTCDLDDSDDPMAYDDGPCACPECDGADHRAFAGREGRLPLSIRIALNLASAAGAA